LEVNDFVESSSPVKRDQEIANNFVAIDSIAECLTEKCSDGTGFYVNRLFNHRLQCLHVCHKIKEKALEKVDRPTSNADLCTPLALNPEVKENDH
jgi:predicted GNAT family acetyltransferase